MSNAFAPIVRARPDPIFGRPVHQGSPQSITARYFSSNPSDSGSLRTPCPPTKISSASEALTPAFEYSAPHPSAGGTLTLLIHAMPSAHYEGSDSYRSHPDRQVSPLTPLCLPAIPLPTTQSVRWPLYKSPQRHRLFQASPSSSGLATGSRRIGFVILQTGGSPPAAPHPTSRRRSCLRLHSYDTL